MRACNSREVDWANSFEEFTIMKDTKRDQFRMIPRIRRNLPNEIARQQATKAITNN